MDEPMKYTPDHPPMQCFMRHSTWYICAKTATTLGVCWHSTGANNTALARYVQPDDNDPDRQQLLAKIGENLCRNDWNHISLDAGVHAFVGKLSSGEVSTVNVGPWSLEAWGVGTGLTGFSLNQGWIQFEICEDNLRDPVYFGQVYREAVHLTAYLCKVFNLDPCGQVLYHGREVPVITCHSESFNLGFGSNHGDVMHWFPRFGKSMETVRQDVKDLLQEQAEYEAKREEQKKREEEDKTKEQRYNTMEEIEKAFPWAADTINRMLGAGVLSGTGAGLDLSLDMIRTLVLVDKAGGMPKASEDI